MALAGAIAAALPAGADAQSTELPPGFAFVADIAPGIVQDLRYGGPRNFTGKPVPGYEGGECVLGEPTARALAAVQRHVVAEGLTLIVLDCYRPVRAVRAFVAWAEAGGAERNAEYHPRIARSRLVAAGYIAARSGHSSGGSVDLTLGEPDGRGGWRALDMGGRFDLFDAVSHTDSPAISTAARGNRQRLVAAMRAQGFVNYRREWWHFRHAGEAFPARQFDFPIPPRRR